MENIGEQLSKTRQAHGLSVADVAARLRIRMKFVEALEKEDWPTVGEFVYVRGFLKNYADLLGLDPAPLLLGLRAGYPTDFPSRAGAEPLAPQPYQFARSPARLQNKPWFPWVMGALTTIAGVLVILVAISVFGLLSPSRQSANPNPPLSQPLTSSSANANGLRGDESAGALGTNAGGDQNASGVNLRLQLTQRELAVGHRGWETGRLRDAAGRYGAGVSRRARDHTPRRQRRRGDGQYRWQGFGRARPGGPGRRSGFCSEAAARPSKRRA